MSGLHIHPCLGIAVPLTCSKKKRSIRTTRTLQPRMSCRGANNLLAKKQPPPSSPLSFRAAGQGCSFRHQEDSCIAAALGHVAERKGKTQKWTPFLSTQKFWKFGNALLLVFQAPHFPGPFPLPLFFSCLKADTLAPSYPIVTTL